MASPAWLRFVRVGTDLAIQGAVAAAGIHHTSGGPDLDAAEYVAVAQMRRRVQVHR